jgi:hypothetical protein
MRFVKRFYNNRNAFPSNSHHPTAAVEYVNQCSSRQSGMAKPVGVVFFKFESNVLQQQKIKMFKQYDNMDSLVIINCYVMIKYISYDCKRSI